MHLALSYLSNGSFTGEINPAEAVRWCTIAAAQGNCQAYRKFYSLFSSENPLPGLVTSKLRAAYWIRKAAFQNTSALAQYSYATILLAIASDTFGRPDITGYSVIPKVLFWLQRARVTAQKGKDQPPAPEKEGHKADCTSLQDEKKQLSNMMP